MRKRFLASFAAALAAAGGLVLGSGTAHAATCTTSSTSGNCGPYTDASVFRTANAVDLVTQNDFSAIPQTLNATDSTTWNVTADTSGQGDQTSVKSYPATQATYTTTAGKPEPSSSFGTTLTSSWTNTIPSGSGQDYEYAFDDWLADPNQNSWTNDFEVMIWTYTNGQVPAGSDTGQVYTDASGTQWEVWAAPGATTVSPDSTVSFVRKVNAASGSVDRMGFYAYLQAHGMLNAAYGIDQLNYGLEICGTAGGPKTYGVTGYSIVPNGGGGGGGGTAPAVTTEPVTSNTPPTANLNGTVNPEGQPATYQFDYGTTTAYGSSTAASDAGSGTTALQELNTVSGFTAGTVYHYRIEATNASGTTFGNDEAFVAGQSSPAAAVGSATNVTSAGATLNATVNPEAIPTTYHFNYGTTPSLGSSTPPQNAGSGTSDEPVSANLAGLAPGTTYYFQIEADGSNGSIVTNGNHTFTTPAATAQVAFSAAAGAKAAHTASLSWTHTVSGSSRVLLVDETVGVPNDSGCSPSATYDGIAMTEVTAVHDNNQHAGVLVVWGLVNPPAVTATVHVAVKNCAGGTPAEMTGGSESFTGASGFGAHATGAGAGSTTTVTNASASASDLEAEFVSNGSSVSGPQSPVTQKFLENQDAGTGAGNTAGGYMPASGGSDTAHWNVTSDWYGAAAVGIAHA